MSKTQQSKDSKPSSSRGDSRKGGKPASQKDTLSTKERSQKELEEQQRLEMEAAEQKLQHLELEGFGRFEFIDGTIYEGQWKLINGIKMRHGEGVLKHGGTTATGGEAGEEYNGSWSEDKMHGYGVYKYTSGAIYSGEWAAGKTEGRGTYEFPDGSKYEGEWKNHKMHGEGIFTDIDGNKWEGIFVDGVYQSKLQKQLKHERMMKKIEKELLENSSKFFSKFEHIFSTSDKKDKKAFKENLLPFFATQEEVKSYFREPYPKYEDRVPDKWDDAMKFLSQYTFSNIPRKIEDAKLVDPNNILVQQFNGLGQIAEFSRETPERTVKIGLCYVLENTWVIVYFFDTAPPK